MFKGTVYAITACLIWGLIFVIPPFLKGFDPLEIALGRHGIYGLVSCLLLLAAGSKNWTKHSAAVWGQAFIFSLVTNILYYYCVVVGVKYSSPCLTALILGVSPIVISFYGNWMEKECSYTSLIVPALMILSGLILVNAPLFYEETVAIEKPWYMMGALAACVALVSWSWFVVANSRFLKNNPSITPQDWSTLIGVSTFVWVLVLGGCYESWQGAEHWNKFFIPTYELAGFIAGCSLLGILCSWVGAFLWNKASGLLPVSFAGQLTIFETIFGVLYYYILAQQTPPLVELAGIALMLSAIFYGMNVFVAKEAHTA